MKMILSAAALMGTLVFQAPANPPMKMGLWESQGTARVHQSGGTEKVENRVVRSCVTKENWLKLMGPTARGACPKTNEVWTVNSYSFDLTCAGKPKSASVTIRFDTPETQHISVESLASADGSPSSRLEATDHWVSSNCGDVSADQPVLVR